LNVLTHFVCDHIQFTSPDFGILRPMKYASR
jgi:hypothetical protein